MAGPPTLSTLPAELVMGIGSYLCPHCTGDDLYEFSSPECLSRLSRTCTRLRDLLQPMLFHSNFHSALDATKSLARLMAFLRAITTRPVLAQAVTTLHFVSPDMSTNSAFLDDCGSGEDCEFDLESAYADKDKQFLNTCMGHIGLPPVDFSSDRGRNPLIEVAIAYCVNLEALQFFQIRAVPSFTSATSTGPNFRLLLPRLQHLIIHFLLFADDLCLEYDRFAPFLAAAPNLKRLALPTVAGFLPTASNLPQLEHLEVLDFDEAAPTFAFVRCLIVRCKKLRKFKLHLVADVEENANNESWTVGAAWNALLQAKNTLQDLAFEAHSRIPLGNTASATSSIPFTFADFIRLSVLATAGRCLAIVIEEWKAKFGKETDTATRTLIDDCTKQIFPSTLTSLTIWDPVNSSITLLNSLARAKLTSPDLYPRLKAVRIQTSPSGQDWQPGTAMRPKIAQLVPEFAAIGVRFEVHVYGHPGWPVTAAW
ncbi:uncharacterized protein BDV17DRAFT_291082 [Aspergillus undulatus]|uniref:uncharacterized protein n=1 Tax=Aspergillus undulatus TaxID=1810928 RepID=UPI003CCDEC20